ncbi:MAG: hypothetical protein EOL91_07245 [Actinobacteria bacterium]|nr:hypothetical protein [Actinomycetota bacterium]
MSAVYRPDWSALLNRLRARSQQPLAHIGRRCGMCERTINRLARGEVAEPRFSQAMQLLDIAADTLGADDWRDIRR